MFRYGLLTVFFAVSACKTDKEVNSASDVKHLFASEAATNSMLAVGAPCTEVKKEKSSDGSVTEMSISSNEALYYGFKDKKKSTCGKELKGNRYVDMKAMNVSSTLNNMNLITNTFANYFRAPVKYLIDKVYVAPDDFGRLEDGKTTILKQTRIAASRISDEGTFVWYFNGHSSPSEFGVNHQRFTMQEVMREIRKGAGKRLKRLVLILETCYAGRVIDGVDPIRASSIMTASTEVNLNDDIVRSVFEAYSETGNQKLELIIMAASNATSYSYFTNSGSAYTKAIATTTSGAYNRWQPPTRDQYKVGRWLEFVTQNAKANAASIGSYQSPTFKLYPESLKDELLFVFEGSQPTPVPVDPDPTPIPVDPIPTPVPVPTPTPTPVPVPTPVPQDPSAPYGCGCFLNGPACSLYVHTLSPFFNYNQVRQTVPVANTWECSPPACGRLFSSQIVQGVCGNSMTLAPVVR